MSSSNINTVTSIHSLEVDNRQSNLNEIKTVINQQDMEIAIESSLSPEELKAAQITVSKMYPLRDCELNEILPRVLYICTICCSCFSRHKKTLKLDKLDKHI